ncbi:MAG: hypothetical protein ABIK23_00570 [candidate division WOR-3 bacterium]
MADPRKRSLAYRVKATPERTKEILDARLEEMRARYDAVMEEIYAMETEVKAVLNDKGVSTSLYVPYLNFGRQLWKLSREQGISGESLALAAKVLLDKWAARGLNPDILATIRSQVFNIAEPKK